MLRGYFGQRGFGTMDGHHLGHFGGWGIAGMILMIVLWLVVIAAIVLAIRALGLHSRHQRTTAVTGPMVNYPPAMTTGLAAPASNLLGILEQRYAKGEITRDEFLQRKADLGLGGEPAAPASTPPVPPPVGLPVGAGAAQSRL